ncbi:MAG: hypothetical protein JWM43_2581 [Acidobacteriaceae bacterium]|nr:hypothetical protein [Acidobacteriaceae bacterium]
MPFFFEVCFVGLKPHAHPAVTDPVFTRAGKHGHREVCRFDYADPTRKGLFVDLDPEVMGKVLRGFRPRGRGVQ